jgi:arabinose-5-phosphate isomerase
MATTDSPISIASRVLRHEAQAILDLIPKLDHEFERAVELIEQSKGRVVLTGMGKSGHIAVKVAATLASTGTPAFFLHPAEGVHGDLGMVTADDIVLAYSNSGETNEILNILPSLRRIGAKLIAVVGRRQSTLGRNADITLETGMPHEADTLGLAPTCSTTVTLALGDALAITLMERRHFTSEKFAVFHPGGSLGRKLLLTVKMVMHGGEENPVIGPEASVKDALFIITDKGYGVVNIVDADGRLLGILTDGDIRRGLEQGAPFLERHVGDVMTANPTVITPDKLAAEALHVMDRHRPRPVTVLPVTDASGKSLGLVHLTDLLKQGIV